MKKDSCRLCKSKNLVEFLNLGHHPHSDNFRKDKDLPEVTYPLTLNQCQDCEFVQLGYTVSPDVLYDDDYLYESSITKTADKHWIEFVDSVSRVTEIKGGKVLDIGSNDGTLLSKFKDKGFEVQGIDPCKQIADIANSRGIPTFTGLFGKDNKFREYNLITGSNVFAHIDDLDQTMLDVDYNLAENGVFIFESPYLANFIKDLEYDTIYHQHLSYLALRPLVKFLDGFGMEIFDVEFSEIHGGCFRCYIARKGERQINAIVSKFVDWEDFTLEKLQEFAKKVEENRMKLLEIVLDFKRQGKKVIGVSSPAKGMTLLNYTGVGKFLDFVTDVSKLKQGRFTPGSHLEIKSDKDLVGDEVGLLLAWNFLTEILKNVPQITEWIIPIPYPHIIKTENGIIV